MDYIKENIDSIRIITVNLERPSFLEAADFQEMLDEELAGGYKKFVVDLGACSYIDSVFLGAIIVSLRKLVALDGDIKLVKPSLSETNLNLLHSLRIFNIYDTKKDALNSFNKVFVAPPEEFVTFGHMPSSGYSFPY